MSTKTEYVSARMAPDLKHEVEKILEKIGLSQTEAIRIYYKQILLNKGLPFEVKIPNATTQKAMQNAENNIDVVECDNMEDLFNKLES